MARLSPSMGSKEKVPFSTLEELGVYSMTEKEMTSSSTKFQETTQKAQAIDMEPCTHLLFPRKPSPSLQLGPMGPTSLQELWLQYRNLSIVTKLAKSNGHCRSV